MKLWSDSFKDGAKIPTPFAFCKIDGATHAAMSDNRNPHLAWSDLPENTRSLVLICHDYDAVSYTHLNRIFKQNYPDSKIPYGGNAKENPWWQFW